MSGFKEQKQISSGISFVRNNRTAELYRSDITPPYTELYRQNGALFLYFPVSRQSKSQT